MVKDLFYEKPYHKMFESVVTEKIKEKGKTKIVLENTLFYPEGGGQPADTGFINNIEVVDVQEKDGKIYHTIAGNIEEGTTVKGKIDFESRFVNMQHHTAEHIVAGLICKKYNAENVGFNLGKERVTLDVNVVLNNDDIKTIEREANDVIYKNLFIKSNFYTEDEAKNIEYRSKKDLNGDIRLVEIPGVDICACCGLHVKRTGEIGLIKLLSVEKYKSGSRIYIVCGKRALENYNFEYDIVNRVSVELSAKHENVYSSILSLKDEIKDLDKKNTELQNQLFDIEVANLENKNTQILFKENLDMEKVKSLCTKLKDKVDRIAGVFSKEDDLYKYMIMSDFEDVKNISKEFNEVCSGKGGGNKIMAQGQVNAEKEKIEEFFKKYE